MPYVCNLSPELQKYTKEVLNEDPDRRAADIEHIRNWIKKQPHLKARTDDYFILMFLRGCKFSLERTKKKIDAHYTIKGMIPEWFKGRDPSDPLMRRVLKSGGMIPLPQLDKKGRRVFLNRNGAMDPRKFPVDDMMKAFYMLIDVLMEEDEIGLIKGSNFIMDIEGFSATHMLAFTPTMAKKSTILFQDGYPVRPQGFHYINTSTAFESLFTMFKSFLNEKLRKRITVHASDLTPLFDEIPQEMLTKEYGGKEDMQEIIESWLKRLDDRRDWILEQEKYTVDESKRPGKPKTTVDLFGIDGSFRKLNVD